MGSDNLRSIIAIAVAGVWAVTSIAAVITQQYQALEVVTPVMMIVTGFLFGFQVQIRKTRQQKENGETGDKDRA